MTPAVIADSDGDESDSVSAPERVPPTVPPQDSSPTTTHPSGSTDPTIFKNIYNEHRDAANQHVIHQIEESGELMDASSFDNGFLETRGTVMYDKSLWDVPSSPAFAQPKPFKKQDGSLNTRTKITRGLRRQLDDIGYVSQEDELPEMTAQSRKKRRVERDAGSDDLVSTAPIESDPSFIVAPTALKSQGERHVSVHDGALGSATKPLEQRCANVMSSGTATNINTPRSNEVVLSEATPDIKGPAPARAAVSRDSWPASTAVLVPVLETKKGTAKEKGRKETKKKVIIDSDGESEQGNYSPQEAEHDGSDFEKPLVRKKQRGRPRKTDAAAPQEKKPEMETNGKRKRGRPKKSAAALKPDSDDEVQEIAPAIPAPAHAEPVTKPQQNVEAKQLEQLGSDVAEPDSQAVVRPVTKETRPGTPTSNTKVDTDISTVKKTVVRAPSTSVEGSGRPLYRVGLSKKTRIAPLLKVIRK